MGFNDNPVQFLETFFQKMPHLSRFVVAYSGGVDSHVLLYVMSLFCAQKKIPLEVIHVNHGLSQNAGFWQAHCQKICQDLHVQLHVEKLNPLDKSNDSIETWARHRRYQIFAQLMDSKTGLLLAHHSDDQAETILFRLLRGAGVAGLAGMPVVRSHGKGFILRPFLTISKNEIEDYARQKELQWIDDESNQSLDFSRNFLRHDIFPKLQQRWPAVSRKILQTAKLCENANILLEELAVIDFASVKTEKINRLSILPLKQLNEARQANVIRYWLKKNNFPVLSQQQIRNIICNVVYAKQDANPLFKLEGKGEIRRFAEKLYLVKSLPDSLACISRQWQISNPLDLGEMGELQAKSVLGYGLKITEQDRVIVKFRQGGERIRPSGDNHNRDLKYLWQKWQVPPWVRPYVPLIYINDQLVAVADLTVANDHVADPGERGYKIFWRHFLD